MENNNKNKKLINKLTHKYRLIVYNDNTFEEVWYMRLSRLNLIALFGTAIICLITLTILIVAYTPAKEFIPGYPDGDLRRNIILNSIKLDSLEHELAVREQYYNNIRAIISGEDPEEFIDSNENEAEYKEITFTKSPFDSILREQIEQEEQFNLILADNDNSSPINFSTIHFFVPLKGIVTNKFNIDENHFGVDVVTAPNKVVAAVLEGTVTMANWTLETGYVIQIQHANNLISVYKHNSVLLKKVGNFIKAGEAIAIVGNSGELTTGPHLHFELWHDGKPLDPEDYISF
ncbi:MAG: M23 family metallopeptidase [Bacteroidales bacterium]|nr:M23 family metallopeptidase [Bacteroidales bacterium]